MSAEVDTFSTLSASAALTALVSQRIYPDVAPEPETGVITHPMVVYARSATTPTFTINGDLVAAEITMNINCYAGTRSLAEQIGDAVVTAMRLASFYESGRATLYDEDVNLYAAVIDFQMWELPPAA